MSKEDELSPCLQPVSSTVSHFSLGNGPFPISISKREMVHFPHEMAHFEAGNGPFPKLGRSEMAKWQLGRTMKSESIRTRDVCAQVLVRLSIRSFSFLNFEKP